MHSIDDQLLKQAAEANGVTPLAEQWGVKMADANGMLAEVTLNAFHEKLARHGYGANNEQQAAELEQLGNLLLQKAAADEQFEGDDQGVLKMAIANLSQQLGHAPDAQASRAASAQAAYEKTAQYVQDPEVMQHLVARYEALNLLQ